MTARSSSSRHLVAIAIAVIACSAAACGDRSADAPRTTTTIPQASTTLAAPTDDELAAVFVDAWRFTSSHDGETAQNAQARLVAECMSAQGWSYEAEVAVPGAPTSDAVDYGLVDYFLASGQDRANQQIESALSPTDALAWREALNGPARSQSEEVPVSDDPAVVGCGPASLPQFVGVTHAPSLSELIGASVAMLQVANEAPEVVAARTSHDACLVAADPSLGPLDTAEGFAPFPVVRDWFTATFDQAPATLRAAIDVGDPAVVGRVQQLRDRERALYLADVGCDASADPAAALDAAMANLSRQDPTPDGQRREFVEALTAARDAASGP